MFIQRNDSVKCLVLNKVLNKIRQIQGHMLEDPAKFWESFLSTGTSQATLIPL